MSSTDSSTRPEQIDVSGSTIEEVKKIEEEVKKIEEEEEEEEIDEETCEFCNRAFSTVLECSIHENTCKANNNKHQFLNKKQKQVSVKKERVCHICGSTGHMTCPMERYIDKD
jgi:hypothetical protein